ncbi:MAG: SDR family NAD(P)-dependent oxidoreductase [Chlamydiales bacterium]|nr:SDR family NAD(P)-dependent oxidoreductase [Chlamydiales bacterium]
MFSLACVTGASSGIGKELCKLLAKRHIPLLITGRDERALHALAEELTIYVAVHIVVCDLSKKEDRTHLIQEMRLLKPDLVVNNAGFGLYGEAISYAVEDTLSMIEVNIAAVAEITLEAIILLKKDRRTGTILNVSSVAAYFRPFPSFVTYAASKDFVLSFSRGVDNESSAYGIRVLTAVPGQVKTGFRFRAAKGVEQKDSSLAMSASFAAKQIWKQIQTQKRVSLFDWRYKMAILLSHFIPKPLIAMLLKHSIKRLLA